MSKDATSKLDALVAQARQDAAARESGYREQALKIYPWVCGRCARTFTRTNLRELTVHHRDHNHHNNPSDGSNWELLCLYCHDNEHQIARPQQVRHRRSPLLAEAASTEPRRRERRIISTAMIKMMATTTATMTQAHAFIVASVLRDR